MARFIKYQARGAFLEPTEKTINDIDGLIRYFENYVPMKMNYWMNELPFYMALVNQGEARKMSFGPYDPSQTAPEEAWQIPVRRITDTYYLGWKVRRLGLGTVQLYNDSREAYFIEYGINWRGEGRRVRRPIRKLSLIRTLKFMMQTDAYSRVWSNVFIHGGKGYGFTQVVQGAKMGGFGGRQLGRRLPE